MAWVVGERGVGEGVCERGGLRTQAEVGRFNSTISLAVILRDCVCVCVCGGGGGSLFIHRKMCSFHLASDD